MRLLKRLLRGPHERRPRHLDSCAECRLRQRRERQYLERLRGAEVPVASDDLTARLLARTEELARNGPPAAPPAVRRRFRAARGFRPALRAAVLVAGSAAAATALLGGSAYLMGGDPAPPAAGTPASVFLQRDLAASGAAAAVEAGRRGARRLEPHRRTRFHPGRSTHGGAARHPALRGLDLPRAPRTRLPPGLGQGRGAGRRRHRGTAPHRRPELRHRPGTAQWRARAVRRSGRRDAHPRCAGQRADGPPGDVGRLHVRTRAGGD